MSKREGKRGFVRPQGKTASSDKTEGLDAFGRASREASDALLKFEAHCDDVFARGENATQDASDAWRAAADTVFSVPAPNGEALARKLELFAYPHHIDALLSDPATRTKIADGDDEEERKLLVMWLDAMALSGVVASVTAPTLEPAKPKAPTWTSVAAKARSLYGDFGRHASAAYPWRSIMADLARQCAALGQSKSPSAEKMVEAATTAEVLARVLAEDRSGYRNYAVNPEGLRDLVAGVTAIQAATRGLAGPLGGGEAINKGHFSDAADGFDREKALAAQDWNKARDRFRAAEAAVEAASVSDQDALYDASAEALVRWEELPPPTVEAYAEVMGASFDLQYVGQRAYRKLDDPRTLRDLLDNETDAGAHFAARYYLHALRLAGSKSPALTTPPIQGLFPAFVEPNDDLTQEEMRQAWKTHHGVAVAFPGAISRFASWRMPKLPDGVAGSGPVQAVWQYSAALYTEARAVIAEYEALGGRFSLVRQPDGRVWFGTMYPRDPAGRGNEIEYLVNSHEMLRETISDVVERRDGILGDETAPGTSSPEAEA